MSERDVSFETFETVCDILREYGAASVEEFESGPTIYEADYAKRIVAVLREDIAAEVLAPVEALVAEWKPGSDESIELVRLHGGPAVMRLWIELDRALSTAKEASK